MPSYGSILGIDLRDTAVKLVELENKKDKTLLKAWGLAEIPYALIDKHPQKEEAQAEALIKLIQGHKIRARDAVVVATGSDLSVKLFTLSKVSKDEAENVIRWKFAEEISFPIEEAIVDFYALPFENEFSEKVDYVAACMHNRLYHEIEYVTRRAGLRLAAITILPDCLVKLFEDEINKEKSAILSLLYMGRRAANISILKEGKLEFNRELIIGGENITLAMSGVLVSPEGRVEVTPEDAEKIKFEHGVPIDIETYPKLPQIPVSQLMAMVRPALERVKDEVMRTFEFYKGQTGEAAINKIIFTGGVSLTKNLPEYLSTTLGSKVVVPFSTAGYQISDRLINRERLESILPRFSGAIGAGLIGGEKINLMPEEIKHHWRILLHRFLKPQHLISTFLGFLIFIYLALWLQSFSLGTELSRINRRIEEIKPRIAVLDVIQKTAQEEQKREVLIKSYGEKRSKVPENFDDLCRLIPQSVVINQLNFTPAELHLWGTAFERGDTAENILSQFVLALSASPRFGDVKLLQAQRNSDYENEAFNFEIIAKIKI